MKTNHVSAKLWGFGVIHFRATQTMITQKVENKNQFGWIYQSAGVHSCIAANRYGITDKSTHDVQFTNY